MTGDNDATGGPRAGGDRDTAHEAVRHDRAALDDPAEHEHRPGRSPLTVALVAGAVLMAGGGAYWAAAAAGPASAGAGGAVPAVLAISGWTASGPQGGGGPVTVAGKLPSGPAAAPVYVPDGTVTRGEAGRLAAALRVTGGTVSGGGVWKVAPVGGRPGPTLQVAQRAPGSWTYVRDGAGATCGSPAGSVNSPQSSGSSSDTHRAVCYGPGAAVPQGEPVSPAAARRAAAPVLAALGLGGAAVDASRTAGAVREVTADPVVGGLPTSGWSTSVQVAPDGTVLNASGRLLTPTRGATYPVVSAAQAVTELRTAGGARLCGGGVMHPDAGASAGRTNGAMAGGDRTTGGPARQNLPCLAASPALRVDGAVFGLSAQVVSGRAELVPSWLLTVERPGAAAPSVLAVPAVSPAWVTAPVTAPGRGPAAPPVRTAPETRVTSYTVDGRTVTLRFWGGVCSDYAAHVVEQGSGSVRVRIAAVPKGDPQRPCPMIAKSLTAKVTLAGPLAGRAVYDASNGDRVPAARG